MTALITGLNGHTPGPVRFASELAARDAAIRTARSMIAAGERPGFRVRVKGIDGLLLRITIDRLLGMIILSRLEPAAREAARVAIAEALGVDQYAFDLEMVAGARRRG